MYIVTGGAGLIGSAMVWGLNQRGIRDILVVDHLGTSEKWKNLASLQYTDYMERDEFAARNWRLLEQGGELNRHRMLQEFREDRDSVLFGTDSFWTGVDVPGEALSMVIVTKLPFASPGHPLIAARLERIRMAGKSDFANYSLPEAVLKFRQGVGRLIRSRSDRGYIVVLDPRVISKGYGRGFIDSIPYKLMP